MLLELKRRTATMSRPSKTASKSPSPRGDASAETNVDLDKLRSAQREHRRQFIWEWALRLANSGHYPDSGSLKAELVRMGFVDVDEFLSDEDLGYLYGLNDPPDSRALDRDDPPPSFIEGPQPPLGGGLGPAEDRSTVGSEQEAALGTPPATAARSGTDRPVHRRSEGIPAGRDIGRLTKVSPGEAWRSSEFDLSDWLVENPDVAKDVLGFELRKIPGGFSGGSPSFEDSAGRQVLIVSHLQETSNDRLGEFIGRMASSRAKVRIWIVTHARPEDLRALGWLNELGACVYLVQLEAVRIDNSPPAPLLTLLLGAPGQQTRT
jgi:hypothetical protein